MTELQRSNDASTQHVSFARISAVDVRQNVDDRLSQRTKEHRSTQLHQDTVAISARARSLALTPESSKLSYGRDRTSRTSSATSSFDAAAAFQSTLDRTPESSSSFGGSDESHVLPGSPSQEQLKSEPTDSPFWNKDLNSDESYKLLGSETSNESANEEDESEGENLFEKLRAKDEDEQDFLFGLTDQPYGSTDVHSQEEEKSDFLFASEALPGDRMEWGSGLNSPDQLETSSIRLTGDSRAENSVLPDSEEMASVVPSLGISAEASMRVTGPPEKIYSVKESQIGAYQLGADGNRRYFVEEEQEGPFGSKGQVAQLIGAYLRQVRGQGSGSNGGENAGVDTLG